MSKLLAYLQLCRLPTVFTAMADIFLGYLLVHDGIVTGDGCLGEFLLLLGASSCLYLSGMVLNDVCDVAVDSVERPGRPIPSGRISERSARIFWFELTAIGLVLTILPIPLLGADAMSFAVAMLLVACIVAYDMKLKRTPLGPLPMSLCRFLNVLLGASTAPAGLVSELLATPQLAVPVGLGIYILGVTWFARTEARLSSRLQLAGAMLVVNLGLATLIGWIVTSPGENRTAVLVAMAVIVLTINRRLAAAISQPVPQRVQPAIRTMLLSIIVLDATLIAHRLGADGAGYAIATVALLIPAMLLGRWIRLT